MGRQNRVFAHNLPIQLDQFTDWIRKILLVSKPSKDFINFPQFLLLLLALRDDNIVAVQNKTGVDDAIVVDGGE